MNITNFYCHFVIDKCLISHLYFNKEKWKTLIPALISPIKLSSSFPFILIVNDVCFILDYVEQEMIKKRC